MSVAQVSARQLVVIGSAFRAILRQPHLRALFIAITAYGVTYGSSVPFVSVWLNQTFAASDVEIGVLITVRGLGGAIGVPLLGWISDRTGQRRPGIIVAFVLAVGSMAGLINAPSYPVALVISFFSGVSAVALCLVLVEELLDRLPEGSGALRTTISANERMSFNLGGSLGSALGSTAVALTGAVTGGFWVALVAGAIGLVVMVLWPSLPAAGAAAAAASRETARLAAGPAPAGAWAALVLFVVAVITLFCTTWTRSIFVPLYVVGPLGEPASSVGPLFFTETLTVIILSPFSGLVIERWGAGKAVLANLVIAALGAFLLPFTQAYWQVFAVSLVWGAGQAVGSIAAILYASRLIPGRAGFSVGVYAAAFQAAPIVAGLGFGVVSERFGLPSVFWLAGILVTLGSFVMLASIRYANRAGVGVMRDA